MNTYLKCRNSHANKNVGGLSQEVTRRLLEKVACITGFPTGVENMGVGRGGGGALQNLMKGGGLKSIHGGTWVGGGFKCCQKIPVKEFI